MCASQLERPRNSGLLIRSSNLYMLFCLSEISNVFMLLTGYAINAIKFNLVGGTVLDLSPACILIISFAIPCVIFYPPELLRILLLLPHIMMSLPCLCSHCVLCTLPHSSHLPHIYLSFKGFLHSYVFYQFFLLTLTGTRFGNMLQALEQGLGKLE